MDYKFRGKSCETTEWVYGSLLIDVSGTYWIVSCEDKNPLPNVEWIRVSKNTVGQYIGRNDIDNKELYDGDIVSVYRKERNVTELAAIYYDQKYCSFLKKPFEDWQFTTWDEVKKVGTIYDMLNL